MPISGFKKICIIIASSVPGLEKTKIAEWLHQQPELNIIANVEPVFIFGGNSAEVGPEMWLRLAEAIQSRLDRFAGFVVIHDIDNLLYTTAALSFLSQGIHKPIIFTGNQSSVEDPYQVGFKANLINAVQVANFAIPEVCLMFGNRLLRANQAHVTHEGMLTLFSAPLDGVLGRIDFSIRIFDKLLWKNNSKVQPPTLNTNVEIINLSPLIDLKLLSSRAHSRDAILVNAHKYHALPEDLRFLFAKITPDTPVIIWSRLIKAGAPDPINPKNIMIINNMTWPATAAKTLWAIGQTKSLKKISELMRKNIAGEIMGS